MVMLMMILLKQRRHGQRRRRIRTAAAPENNLSHLGAIITASRALMEAEKRRHSTTIIFLAVRVFFKDGTRLCLPLLLELMLLLELLVLLPCGGQVRRRLVVASSAVVVGFPARGCPLEASLCEICRGVSGGIVDAEWVGVCGTAVHGLC